MTQKISIAVLGAGSWGTALAVLLAENGHDVRLWDIDTDNLARMRDDRVNQKYLPNASFPDNLTVVDDLAKALADVRDVLSVVPSHAFEKSLNACKPHFSDTIRLAWATKGMDHQQSRLISDVAKDVLGNDVPLAVISGPSFAKEVGSKQPTAVNCASTHADFAADLVGYFQSERFFVRVVDDMIGVQLAGTLKNIIAIATGISDGLGFGMNTRCAVMTQGLQEMMQLGETLGAKRDTFMHLAGVGDLVLTCSDDQSRNRRFGLALAEGISIEDAEQKIGQVVEGKFNAQSAHELAQKHGLHLSLLGWVYKLLQGHVKVQSILEVFKKF